MMKCNWRDILAHFSTQFNFFFVIYILLVLFDYFSDKTFQWLENFIQTLFILFFYGLFSWATRNKKDKNSNS